MQIQHPDPQQGDAAGGETLTEIAPHQNGIGQFPQAHGQEVVQGIVQNAEPEVYSFENKELCESRVEYRLVEDGEAKAAGATALAAYRTLGCRDGARLDLRSDAAGVPQFLEVNPLAGLHPTHSDLPILASLAGLSYESLIGEILQAARQRTGLGLAQSRKRRISA